MPNLLDHAKAVVTGGDADRLAARREAKQQIAALEAKQQEEKAIRSQISGLDERETQALQKHKETTEPIQETLVQIEGEATDLIVTGTDIPDSLARKRKKAVETIATANAKLEVEVEALKRLRNNYLGSLGAYSSVAQEISKVKGRLRRELADPRLLGELYVAGQGLRWAKSRLDTAKEALDALLCDVAARDRELASQSIVNKHAGLVNHKPPDKRDLGLVRELGEAEAELDEAEKIHASSLEDKMAMRQQIEDS